jgi:hypothetical protein
MNRLWSRDVLRHVDAWACRDGTPEDDEDRRKGLSNTHTSDIELEDLESGAQPMTTGVIIPVHDEEISRVNARSELEEKK